MEDTVPVLDSVLGKTLPFNIHWQLVKQTPHLTLSKRQVETFWTQGHLSIPEFIDPAEVDEIERIFRHLFDVRAGWKEGHFYDMAGSEQSGDFKLPQEDVEKIASVDKKLRFNDPSKNFGWDFYKDLDGKKN